MTILIKGMKMPTWCNDCPFNDKEYDVCVATTDRRSIRIPVWERMRLFHREKWCPLIEVPTPHGRLIDADDFDSRIRAAGGLADEELTDDFKDGVLSVLTLMKTQNTVIEAEEG